MWPRFNFGLNVDYGKTNYIYPTDDIGRSSPIPFAEDFGSGAFGAAAAAAEEEGDLVYYPQDDAIPFPDDMVDGPFCRSPVKKKQVDPPGEMPSLTATVEKNVASVAAKPLWREVIDNRTGRVYYYNRRTRQTTWARPNRPEIVSRPPRRYDGDSKAKTTVHSHHNKAILSPTSTPILQAEKQMEENKRNDDDKENSNAIVGDPVIFINRRDDASDASTLSASNVGWYRQQNAAANKRALTGTLKDHSISAGVIFVQGSCSERVNGIYIYAGCYDSVAAYTKVESYDDATISFRIYRRQLSPDMSRRWFLCIGPGYGGTRTENDIDLYSAPALVDGPATCFVDEIPPRNKWEPVDGSGMEGTRGPCLLWIPKKIDVTGGGDMTQNIVSPEAHANMRNGDDLAQCSTEDLKCKNELPPNRIVVHKKGVCTVSSSQKGSNESCRGAAERALPSTSSSASKEEIRRVKVDDTDSQPSSVIPSNQNIFRKKDGNADDEPTPGDRTTLKQENTLSARNGSSGLPVALAGPPRVQNMPTDLHEVRRPPRIIEPSKSTDTTPTVASSTFDTAEADVRTIYVTSNHDEEKRESNESLCSTKSSGSLSDSDVDVTETVYDDIGRYNFADLLELPEDVDTWTVFEHDSNTNSDVAEFSDLSDGEDGVEDHEYNLLREWRGSIGENRGKPKVVKWTDQIEKDTTETYDGNNNGDQKVETDEDYQFYARTVGRESLIAVNIGAALRRFNSTSHCEQLGNRADATMTVMAEKMECMAPGPCRCSACKQRVVRAYLEHERREFYEI